MGAALGLGFAVGLLMVLRGLAAGPRRQAVARDWSELMRSAGKSLGLGVLAAGFILVLLGIPAAALIGGTAAAATPVLVGRHADQRRRKAQRAAWPDAIDDLLTAVRAGVPLSDAICEAASSGPEPLRPGFAAHAAAWRRGDSFPAALAAMQRHFSDATADRVAVSLALAAESGGRNVGRVLATQGDFLRADLRMRGEIDARQSWTVSAAKVAVAAPWFALGALSIRGESAQAYATAQGAVVLVITAVIGAAAYWAMRRIAALPQPQRLPELRP